MSSEADQSKPMEINQSDIPLTTCKFRVIDVEATSVNPNTAAVIEVAYQDFCLKYGLIASFDVLINPGCSIPPQASAVAQLTDADVEKAPRLNEVLPIIVDRRSVPVGHDIRLDSALIPFNRPWLCTQRLAKHLWPTVENYGLQYLRYWLRLDNPASRGLGPHQALADAKVTALLLQRELIAWERMYPDCKTVGQMMEIVAQPVLLQSCPLSPHRGRRFEDLDLAFLNWIIRQGQGNWDRDLWATTLHYRALLESEIENGVIPG